MPLEVDHEDRRVPAGRRAELGRRQPADDVRAAAVGHDSGAGRPGKIEQVADLGRLTTAARRHRAPVRAGRCGGRSSRRGSGHGRAGRGPPGRSTGVGGPRADRRDRTDDVGEERVRRRPTLADDALQEPDGRARDRGRDRVVAPAVPASGHDAMVTHRARVGRRAVGAAADRPLDWRSCPTATARRRGNVFSAKTAESDLRDYLRNGPDATTRALVDAIRAEGVDAATLLDIGAGVGAVQIRAPRGRRRNGRVRRRFAGVCRGRSTRGGAARLRRSDRPPPGRLRHASEPRSRPPTS